MNLVSKFLKKKPVWSVTKEELVAEQVCPNCWGHQEFDKQFIAKYPDFTKSNVNQNKTQRKAFIQQFVETHVAGIHLKSDGDKIVCRKCNKVIK